MPARHRWWAERTKEYVEAHRDEWGKEHADGVRMALRRFDHGVDHTDGWRRTPGIWARVDVHPIPQTASEVTAANVLALRDSPEWAPKTRSFYLQVLRGFLRHHGSSVAQNRHIWAIDAAPLNRRWLSKVQLTAAWEACRDEYDRLAVAATGFNGLRRVEVLRLRARDCRLVADDPVARIWGKGPNGGKHRTIPLTTRFYGALVALQRSGPEAFFPWKETSFDARLSAVGRLAGIPENLSAHTLRRTFGRLAYYEADVPLVSIQRIYGHASPAMTAHYIGADQAEMAEGVARFDRAMDPTSPPTVPRNVAPTGGR